MSRDRVEPTPRAADHVVCRELDGEALLLNLETGTYFGLDAVGTRIWQAIDRQDSIATIVAALMGVYDVDRGTAERDVRRLITQLVDSGLLVADQHASPPV